MADNLGTYLARRMYKIRVFGAHGLHRSGKLYFAELSDAERRALEGTLHNEREIGEAEVIPLDVLTIGEVQAAVREDFQLGE